MPIQNYSVLKGTPLRGQVVFDKNWTNPHYRIYLDNAGQSTIDVNVESADLTKVLYVIEKPFTPPMGATALAELENGFTRLDSVAGTLALDYVREMVDSSFMVNEADMSLLPVPAHKRDDRENPVVALLDSSWKTKGNVVYAFGSMYADPTGARGLHDVHMNQGNPGGDFEVENGVWQDGGLFLQSASGEWAALFIAFQTQSWMTDDNGNPLNAKTAGHSRS